MALFGSSDTSLQIVIRAKDEASKVFTDLENKVKKTSGNLKTAGKQLSVGLTAPLAALGAGAVKAAGDFEKSLGDLSTLVGAGSDEMKTFEKGLKEVMKTVPKSGDELGAAAYSIVSAGISDASEALKVLESSGKLAVAGLGQTSEAADLMTSAINAFGLEASEADRVADTIFKTVKNGKTTVAELAQSFGMVAPVAAEMGVSFEELQAATAALTTSGLKTSVAQQQIRAAMSSLLKPTKEADELFEKMGVKSFKQLIQESGGLVGAFNKLKEAAEGDETALAKAAGSVEGLGAILALTGQQSDAFAATLADIEDEANAMDEAFKAQKETFNAAWQELKNKLNVALIELGSAIMPTLKDIMERVADALSRVANWFTNLSPTGQKVVVVMGLILAALGPLLFILGQIIAIAPAVGAAFTFMTGPVGIIIVAIAALIAGIVLLVKNWDKVKEAAFKVWEAIKEKVQVVVDAIMGAFQSFIDFWKASWEVVKTIIKTTLALIVGLVATFLDWIFPNWQENLTKMIEAWRAGWESFKETAIALIDAVVNAVKAFFAGIMSIIGPPINKIKELWLTTWSAIADFFVGLWEPVKEAFGKVIDFIVEKIQKAIDMYNSLKAKLSKPIQSAVGGVGNFFNSAIERGRSILGFQHGGIVPGPPSAAVPIIAHGQEKIIPANQVERGGGGMNIAITFNNPVVREDADFEKIGRAVEQYLRPLMVNHKLDA